MDSILGTLNDLAPIGEEIEANFEDILKKSSDISIPNVVKQIKKTGAIDTIIMHYNEIVDKCADSALKSLVEEFQKIPELTNNIKKDFKSFIERCPRQEIRQLVTNVKKNTELQKNVQENLDLIISKVSDSHIYYLAKELNGIVSIEEISRYMGNIIERCEPTNIVGLIQEFSRNEETKNELTNHKEEVKSKIIQYCTGLTKKELDEEEIYDFIKIVFEEIEKNEGVDILEIKEAGRGEYSRVYQLGEKIIKFGKERATERIPYHRRILQPILRRPIYNKERTEKLFYIEISEKVNELNKISVGKGETYKIYKELRDAGILWTDPKAENLGRLNKPNMVHMKEFNEVDDKSARYNIRRK